MATETLQNEKHSSNLSLIIPTGGKFVKIFHDRTIQKEELDTAHVQIV